MNLELIVLFIFLMISIMLSSVMSTASYFLGDKTPDKEKVSVYECGFDPFHNPGEPFSISFFLIAILFLIFDLEMSYLFPWSSTSASVDLTGHSIVYMFVVILALGLMYEWMKGGLEWE